MAKVVAFGEIMLRLKSPGYERLFQSPRLEATFGGSEANVSVSLACFGMNSAFVSLLPDNDIGDACLRELRGFGVDVSHVVRRCGRMGLYFLESGAVQRPGKVIYDRAGSVLAEARPGDIDWDAALAGATWFHFTGITPAVSESAAALTLEAARAAKRLGLHVSCDLNHRASLWQYGPSADQVMPELTRYVDTLIANEDHFHTVLGLDTASVAPQGASAPARCEAYARLAMRAYPNLRCVAVTLRDSKSASHNDWRACLLDGDAFFVSRSYAITDIVDRVGSGDSFCAGLIYGLDRYPDAQTALEFAVAASCLKHTIPGDYNRVTVPEVEALLGGDATGRVQR